MQEVDANELKILRDYQENLASDTSPRNPELPSKVKRVKSESPHSQIDLLYLSLLIFILILICVMIGSISTPRWSYQGSGQFRWRAGILKCGGCQGKWEGEYFSNILQDAKDKDIKGWENTMNKLYYAGISFVIIESFAIGCCVVWAVFIGFIIKNRKICRDWVVLLFAVLASVLHSAALVAWFVKSEAGFGDCDEVATQDDDDLKVCASHGPAIVIAVEIAVVLACVLFLVVFCKKKYGNSVCSASRLEEGT